MKNSVLNAARPFALRLSIAGALALSVGACGDDDTHAEDEHEHELAEHLCTHLTTGPFADVTAAATAEEELTNTALEHTTANVTLPAGADGGFEGYVSYVTDEAAEIAFAFDTSVTLTVFDATGNALVGEADAELAHEAEEMCAAFTHLFDFEVGTYTLSIESDVDTVQFTTEHADHDEDEHADH